MRNETEKAIRLAITRIEKGKAKVVSSSRKLSIASVADEAGVHRSTIINRYPELAQLIKDKSGYISKNKSSDKKRISDLEIKLANARSENIELKKQLAKAISLQANNIKV